MQLVKSILKYIFYFIIASIAAGTLIITYNKYQISIQKEKELKYKTTYNWKWHDEHQRIQISTKHTKEFGPMSTLRKVHMDKEYAVYLRLMLPNMIQASVYFFVKCKPKTVVKTTQQFSDGSIKELTCTDDGEALMFSTYFKTNKLTYAWKEDLDGFSFKEDIQYWDLTKLRRENTLLMGTSERNNTTEK